ncbi:MAG: hypothetical protein GX134_12685 [candidate division WS1 bacterium]|jgi:type IV secretory pathway ATPase VirB11/archaellum biosynthesis ATPase|nr:hypothetical protein [candidate division WS1 bacterium]
MIDRTERDFRRGVEDLNQRGGRTLSLVDLVLANTLSLELAAYLAGRVSKGASFLTAAVPGGAGKTTVMAALMGAIPQGEPLITVSHEGTLRTPLTGRATWLVHEIQDGPYYGYLWGGGVASYFEKLLHGGRIVSCLHADDMQQLRAILISPPNSVLPELLLGVELVLFLRMFRGVNGTARRVASVHAPLDDAHREVCHWDPQSDTHRWLMDSDRSSATTTRALRVLSDLLDDGVRDWSTVREALSG